MSGGAGYTTFFRALDPRIGRWLTPDPKVQPWQSPYCSMDGNPVALVDPWGDKAKGPRQNQYKAKGGNGRGAIACPGEKKEPQTNSLNSFINNKIQEDFGKTITLDQFNKLNDGIVDYLKTQDKGSGYTLDSSYDGNTGEYVFDIQEASMKRSVIGTHGGDNVKLLGPLPDDDPGGQWIQTAGNINMWTTQVFDEAVKARMGLEKIYASEALINNRLANGGLAGRYNVLRESAGYMGRFRIIGKVGSGIFFGAGTFISLMDAGIGFSEKDWGRVTFATLDIIVSSALFFSGAGFVTIPIYMLYKFILSPPEVKSTPFKPDDLLKPHYCEPDKLRVEPPLLLK